MRSLSARIVIFRIALVLAAAWLIVTAPARAGEPLTEEHVTKELVKFAKDIFHVRVTVEAAGPAVLMRGLLRPGNPAPSSLDLVFHGKVTTQSGFRGDAAAGTSLVVKAHGDGLQQPKSFRGSISFRTDGPAPATARQATDLFDKVLGRGARGGLLGNRPFTRGDDGSWYLSGTHNLPSGPDASVRVIAVVGPDKDDPRTILVSMFAEIGQKGRH